MPPEIPYNIVLVKPEIPQNTGNIGRLCVSTDTKLHIVKPFSFLLEDKYIKRAGMDYWQHLDLTIHDDWEAFLKYAGADATFRFLTTKSETSYWDRDYPEGSYLIFGNESSGLPPDFYERYRDDMATIPMNGKHHRSLNLANAVGITLFECLRQRRG